MKKEEVSLETVIRVIDENRNKKPRQFMIKQTTIYLLNEIYRWHIADDDKRSYSEIVDCAINYYYRQFLKKQDPLSKARRENEQNPTD